MSDSYLSYKTHNTFYKKIAWNLNLINNHPEKIENSIVFFGPSLVEGGVCDSTLESKGIKAFNLGIKHTGKEIELYFLNRILKNKPKKVYLYANAISANLHPMTPLLYTPCDLLSAGQTFNYSFLEYFLTRVSFSLDYLIWCLKGEKNINENYSPYGVAYQYKHYSSEKYEKVKKNQISPKPAAPSQLKFYWRKIYDFYLNNLLNCNSQNNFLIQAKQSVDKYNVEIEGLYVPVIGDITGKSSSVQESYFPKTIKVKKWGDLQFLDSALYWTDEHHLSKEGAIKFTMETVSQNIQDTNPKNNTTTVK